MWLGGGGTRSLPLVTQWNQTMPSPLDSLHCTSGSGSSVSHLEAHPAGAVFQKLPGATLTRSTLASKRTSKSNEPSCWRGQGVGIPLGSELGVGVGVHLGSGPLGNWVRLTSK